MHIKLRFIKISLISKYLYLNLSLFLKNIRTTFKFINSIYQIFFFNLFRLKDVTKKRNEDVENKNIVVIKEKDAW